MHYVYYMNFLLYILLNMYFLKTSDYNIIMCLILILHQLDTNN